MDVTPGDIASFLGNVRERLDLDLDIAAKVLVVAILSGIVAAFFDEILDLPTSALLFTFGGFIAALNGLTYNVFKGKSDVAGLVMGAVAGMLAFTLWFVTLKIIGEIRGANVFKTALTGIVVGMLACGWMALLRVLPQKFLPGGSDTPAKK
ncbi:MAG: hypothetical protein GYB65_12735 [Chloroflexi bacterium]|nr:hypothetical protein [Chloroflexota bacterium]